MKKKQLIVSLLCLAACPVAASVSAESTRANSFISGVIGGNYAAYAISSLLEDAPLMNFLPLEMFALKDQVVGWLEKESSRYFRRWVHEQIGGLGLQGPLSLAGSAAPAALRRSTAAGVKKRTRLRARFSPHHLGLTFLLRF